VKKNGKEALERRMNKYGKTTNLIQALIDFYH